VTGATLTAVRQGLASGDPGHLPADPGAGSFAKADLVEVDDQGGVIGQQALAQLGDGSNVEFPAGVTMVRPGAFLIFTISPNGMGDPRAGASAL
jgi:hypothetical protein